jgi:hypothetical protein
MPPRKKQKRNISGLRNQGPKGPSAVNSIPSHPEPTASDDEFELESYGVHFDSTRVDWEKDMELSDEENDMDGEIASDEFGDEEFTAALALMHDGDDPKDLDWIPAHLRRYRARKRSESTGSGYITTDNTP